MLNSIASISKEELISLLSEKDLSDDMQNKKLHKIIERILKTDKPKQIDAIFNFLFNIDFDSLEKISIEPTEYLDCSTFFKNKEMGGIFSRIATPDEDSVYFLDKPEVKNSPAKDVFLLKIDKPENGFGEIFTIDYFVDGFKILGLYEELDDYAQLKRVLEEERVKKLFNNFSEEIISIEGVFFIKNDDQLLVTSSNNSHLSILNVSEKNIPYPTYNEIFVLKCNPS